MRVRILFYEPVGPSDIDVMFGDKVGEPRQYNVMVDAKVPNDELPSEDHPAILEDFFRNTQNDFFEPGWRPVMTHGQSEPCRSSMVGDIFVLDDRWYKVGRMGFTPLDADTTQRFKETFPG